MSGLHVGQRRVVPRMRYAATREQQVRTCRTPSKRSSRFERVKLENAALSPRGQAISDLIDTKTTRSRYVTTDQMSGEHTGCAHRRYTVCHCGLAGFRPPTEQSAYLLLGHAMTL